jgi:hypothetical protein
VRSRRQTGSELEESKCRAAPDCISLIGRQAGGVRQRSCGGARAVAGQARGFPGALVQPALVNGAAGAVISVRGRPIAVMGFTVVDGRIVEIAAIADPERVRRVAAVVLAQN